jgi:hypothetical protein
MQKRITLLVLLFSLMLSNASLFAQRLKPRIIDDWVIAGGDDDCPDRNVTKQVRITQNEPINSALFTSFVNYEGKEEQELSLDEPINSVLFVPFGNCEGKDEQELSLTIKSICVNNNSLAGTGANCNSIVKIAYSCIDSTVNVRRDRDFINGYVNDNVVILSTNSACVDSWEVLLIFKDDGFFIKSTNPFCDVELSIRKAVFSCGIYTPLNKTMSNTAPLNPVAANVSLESLSTTPAEYMITTIQGQVLRKGTTDSISSVWDLLKNEDLREPIYILFIKQGEQISHQLICPQK